jgi:hypothetical protein
MAALPYRARTFYRPFTSDQVMKRGFAVIHLAFLEGNNRPIGRIDDKVWHLDRDIREMTNLEIAAVRRSPHNRRTCDPDPRIS